MTSFAQKIYEHDGEKFVIAGEYRLPRAGEFYVDGGVVRQAVEDFQFIKCDILREYAAPQVAPAAPDLPAQLKAPFYDRGYRESFEYTGEYRVPKKGEYYWHVEEVLLTSGIYKGSAFIMRPIAPATTAPTTATPNNAPKTYRHDGKLLVESGERREIRKGDYFLSYNGFAAMGPVMIKESDIVRTILTEAFPVLSGFEHLAPQGQLFVRSGERRQGKRGEWVHDSRGPQEIGASQWRASTCIIDCKILKPLGVTVPKGWELTGEWRVPRTGDWFVSNYGYTVAQRGWDRNDQKAWILQPVASQVQTPLYKLRHFNSQTGEGVELARTFTHRVPLEGEYFLAKSGRVARAFTQTTKHVREILRVVGPVSVAGGGEVEKLRELLYKATNELAVAKRKLEEAQNLAAIDAGTIRVVKAQAKRELDRNAQQRDDLHDEFRAYRARMEKAVKS